MLGATRRSQSGDPVFFCQQLSWIYKNYQRSDKVNEEETIKRRNQCCGDYYYLQKIEGWEDSGEVPVVDDEEVADPPGLEVGGRP